MTQTVCDYRRQLPICGREVPQKLSGFNFFQMIPGSRRLSQTATDLCFHIKFQGAGDRRRQSQAVAGSRRLSYDFMETRLEEADTMDRGKSKAAIKNLDPYLKWPSNRLLIFSTLTRSAYSFRRIGPDYLIAYAAFCLLKANWKFLGKIHLGLLNTV